MNLFSNGKMSLGSYTYNMVNSLHYQTEQINKCTFWLKVLYKMNFIIRDCFNLSNYWNIMWILNLGYKDMPFPVLHMHFSLLYKCRKLWSYCQVP